MKNNGYAFTIKKTGSNDFVRNDYYEDILNHLDKYYFLGGYAYELDSRNRLHVHGWTEINPYLGLRSLNKHVHVKCREIFDNDGWQNYIKKSNLKNEEILIQNEVQHSNLFK